jgi:hypothetical protein
LIITVGYHGAAALAELLDRSWARLPREGLTALAVERVRPGDANVSFN